MSCLIDISEYINSRDVRNYLRKLDYQFTTPEAALIIYYCANITLEQKFELWTQIIREMPDRSLKGTMFRKSIDNFHEFLLEYIDIQKKKWNCFSRKIIMLFMNIWWGGGMVLEWENHHSIPIILGVPFGIVRKCLRMSCKKV